MVGNLCIEMQKLPFFNYSVQNKSDASCDLYIDGVIVDASTQQIMKDWWDDETSSSFKSVRESIENSGAKTVNVYVNSAGGQVIEAMAIHDYLNALQAKGVTVNTFGRGLVASAATYILMAGNSTISENSWFMIHNVSGYAYGDVNDIENQATMLRKFNDQVVNFYCNTTGLSKTVVGNMMDKETWMTGTEAKEKGFVKNVETAQQFSNSIEQDKWIFNNTSVLAAYNSYTQTTNIMDFKTIVNDFKAELFNSLKEAGILPKDAAQTQSDAITNALEKAFHPMNEGITTLIDEKVSEKLNAMKDEFTSGMSEQITNAVTEASKNSVSKDELKALQDELTAVKNDIANRTTPANSSTSQNTDITEHKGVSWSE